MYCEGGYHPTRLGDEFSCGRYRVVHKLGYGSFSTVWMARDHTEERYVSLKVITAAASMSSSEANIRDHLRRSNLDHPGRSFVSSLLDDFWIDGPNGRHQCLVSELVGSTLLEAKEASKTGMLPLEVGRAITPQLALGLDYIHSHGILHGDLHTTNISFKLPDIDAWTIERIHESLGKPRTNPVLHLDDQSLGPEVPPYTVESAQFSCPHLLSQYEEGLTRQIRIMDFEEASFSNEERAKSHTPNLLRSPEAFFGESIGLPADIWAAACTIFDIFGKRTLFEPFIISKDEVLLEMNSTLGMLPDRWWRSWESRRPYLLDDGSWNPHSMAKDPEIKPLALRIKQMRLGQKDQLEKGSEQLSAEDLAGLQKLLASLLRYEPSERLTAKETLKSDWVQHLLLDSMKCID